MNRKPWPIVILASIQILSPIFGLIGAALFYGVSVLTLADEHWQFSSNWQKVETYLLPLIVGVLIFSTRRIGYYLAIAGCTYIIYRNMVEFVLSERESPVWVTIVANLFVAGMIAYLLLPRVRMIYLNPALRWWETAPRFLISWPAKLHRSGDPASDAQFHDISIGGAAVDSTVSGWLMEEELVLEFDHDVVPMKMKGRVVYQKEIRPGVTRLGLRWSDSNSNADRSKIRRLVRTLETGGVPISRRLPYWWDDFKEWLPRAFTSKEAWLPGPEPKRPEPKRPDTKK